MTWTDWKSPSSNAQFAADGDVAWPASGFDLEGPYADGGTEAGANLTKGTEVHTHGWAGFGFDTGDIPDGATINGVEVRIDARANDGNDYIDLVTYIYDATNGKSTTGYTTAPASTYADIVEGGAADLWGESSISDADVRSSDFAVLLKLINTDGGTIHPGRIDHIEVRVDYSEAAEGGGAASSLMMGL